MKFIARKGAPNIPLELIEAHESEKLIFFCGAGISYSAGLPLFSGLVENVFKTLGEKQTDEEMEAIKSGLFDRAIGLLEARIVGEGKPEDNLVRKAIIEELTLKDDANLLNHKLILQLSKIKNKKCRLVTTNVDHGFLKADPEIKDLIDNAPKLPFPKPHRWASVVHLHGIIDKNDPNGENLIFTSGDFGTAYLTERWASKFVTELFNHFTVVFIGYSVNDPVLRYMTDAIAAERLRGYKIFQKPYIFSYTKPTEWTKNENLWRSKGIEPILYAHSYNNLYNSLREWWNYIKDGLNAKARIVSKEASVAPLPPYDEAPEVAQLIDVLSEKTILNDARVTGYPAEIFSNISDPPAPIEWLPVLEEKGLLSIARPQNDIFPVHWNPIFANLLHPNKITFNLWFWFLHHLESDIFIKWIIDRGVCLHDDLKGIIKNHIRKTPPKEPYLLFWRIVTSNYVYCTRRIDNKAYEYIRGFKSNIDQLTLSEFSKLLEPCFRIKKAIQFPGLFKDETENKINRPPYKIEVIIGVSTWSFDQLVNLKTYPSDFTELLLTATQFLRKAIKLWEFSGKGDEIHDRSHWDMVSIAPHPQNRRHDNWVILIELCRDLWIAEYDNNANQAICIFEIWKSINAPVFRRLVLHAMTVKNFINGDQAVAYLLEDNQWWLWSVETYREVFRLLNKYWPLLDHKSSKKLIGAILQGPPKKMYRDEISDEEFRRIVDREIWLKLKKLDQFGGNLPVPAKEKLENFSEKYPKWKLEKQDRDEFTSWIETGFGHRVDTTVEDIFNKEIPELIQFLSDDNQGYKDGRINHFREGCKNNKEKAIKILSFLSEHNNWDKDIWHAALVGLADSNNGVWETMAPLIIGADLSLYREESWSIAHWVKESAAKVKCNTTEEEYFWTIFKLIVQNCQDFKEPDKINQAVDYAINNPIGIITEALMERFNACKLKANEGIPDGPLKDSCHLLLKSTKVANLAGIIILASRLYYFHVIDPKWTEENLIPLFDLEKSEYCALFWQGYLWSPRISSDLAMALRDNLLGSLKNLKLIGDDAQRLIQLFTVVCLQHQKLYKAQEQRDALENFGVDGLSYIAEFFYHTLRQDSTSADNYWQNRIKPFIRRAWPKSSDFISEKTSEYLSLMIIELNNEFEEAFKIIKPYIRPFSDNSLFF